MQRRPEKEKTPVVLGGLQGFDQETMTVISLLKEMGCSSIEFEETPEQKELFPL